VSGRRGARLTRLRRAGRQDLAGTAVDHEIGTRVGTGHAMVRRAIVESKVQWRLAKRGGTLPGLQ